MGFAVKQVFDSVSAEHLVTITVTLTMAETNRLFLTGDTLIGWPEGTLRVNDGESPSGPTLGPEKGLSRTGMFVSELARLPEGLQIGYGQAADAQRAAQLVRVQLMRAGVEEVK
jgi:hypothetical protein